MPTFADLNRTHPEYQPGYWKLCRLLADGGNALLTDDEAMARILPQHEAEPSTQYKVRRGMAYYENIVATVLNSICAGLGIDPIRVEADGAPSYYDEFAEDVSPLGGRVCSLGDLVKQLVHMVMLYRRAWLRVDMPPATDYGNLAQQEASGALRAYVVPLAPEYVTDWEETQDGTGELAWALCREEFCVRADVLASTSTRTVRFLAYDREQIRAWEFDYDSTKAKAPKPEATPDRTWEMAHPFQRVPMLRFEPAQQSGGLYAMAALEPLARAHFQASNALAYAEARVLFTPRTTFLDGGSPVDPFNAALSGEAASSDRAVAQPHGTANVVQMRAGAGAGDRVEYPAPPTGSFTHAAESCASLVEAMHRVVHQMALSTQSTTAALGRSGESKMADRTASEVVLAAFGEMVRTFLSTELYPMLARGRDPANQGGEQDIEWNAKGIAKFSTSSGGEALADGLNWNALGVRSATAHAKFMDRTFRAVFTDQATEAEYEQMVAEEAAAFDVAKQQADRMQQALASGDGADDGADDKAEDDAGGEQPGSAKADNKPGVGKE